MHAAAVKLVVLATVLAVVLAEQPEQRELQQDESRGRIKTRILTKLLRKIAPFLFMLKIKVVVISVIASLAAVFVSTHVLPRIWPLWGGEYSAYSGGHPEYEESSYPGAPGPPGYSERSNSLGSLTERVMRGLELAELSYRAVTEDEGERECRARLTCEARQMAKDSTLISKVLDVFSSTLSQFDSGRAADCDQLGCGTKTFSRRRAAPGVPDQQRSFNSAVTAPSAENVAAPRLAQLSPYPYRTQNATPRVPQGQ